MLCNQFQPSPSVPVRKIDAAKKQSGNKVAELIRKRLIINRPESFLGALGIVRIMPRLPNLSFDLWNAHFLWRMGHVERSEIQPVFGTGKPTFLQQPIVKWRSWRSE